MCFSFNTFKNSLNKIGAKYVHFQLYAFKIHQLFLVLLIMRVEQLKK